MAGARQVGRARDAVRTFARSGRLREIGCEPFPGALPYRTVTRWVAVVDAAQIPVATKRHW